MARILVIAPHMDDEVLGCGGAIAWHVDRGDTVHVCIACNRAYQRAYTPADIAVEQRCTRRAQAILGYAGVRFLDLPDERLHESFQQLLDGLEQTVKQLRPEVAYLPFAGDLHQDHRTAAHAANVALRAISAPFVRRVMSYEVASSTEQIFSGTDAPFLPTVFLDIERQLPRKLKAMAAYTREARRFPHPRSPRMLSAKARLRGMQAGLSAAEAFMMLRERL